MLIKKRLRIIVAISIIALIQVRILRADACQVPISDTGMQLIVDINLCLAGGGGGGSPAGTNGQIQYNNAGSFGGLTVGNTLAAHNFVNSISSTLVVGGTRPVCADLSDSSPSCYIDATNAANITSGTLPGSVMPNLTGDTTSVGATTTTLGLHFGASNAVTLPGSPPVSGAVPYFSGTGSIASSLLLGANLPVFGGGAGTAPFSGTVSGNTTEVATVSGAVTSTHCAKFDASGNVVDAGAACGTSAPGGSSGQIQWNSAGSFAGASIATHSLVLAQGSGPTGLLLGADTVAQGVAAADPIALSLPNCPDTAGNHFNYSTSTHLLTCGSTGGLPGAGGSNTQIQYNSTGALAGSASFTLSGAAVSIGASGSTLGQILLSGNTSGTITIQPQAAAGTYNLNLPITAGAVGAILTSGGGGSTAMPWLADGASGQILTSAGATTIPAYSATPTLGVNASQAGTLGLANSGGSGQTATIKNPSATSAYNFNLPADAGTTGYFLTSAGGGSSPMTWTNGASATNGFPTCTTLSTTTPTLTPANTTFPVKECFTETLSGNTTLTSFASGAAPLHMWTAHIIFTQPSGAHNYTLAFSAGSGEAIVYMAANGCSSLPTMPTGTGHSVMLDIMYNTNPASPQIDVISCPTDGS